MINFLYITNVYRPALCRGQTEQTDINEGVWVAEQ